MKKLKSILAMILLGIIILAADQIYGLAGIGSEETPSYQSAVFPEDVVIDVNIEMEVSVYEEMIENATDETYVLADITYNGTKINNVAIRPKGNSSLRDVAQSDSDRYSYKIDLDAYVDGQNLYGLTKLNLNNIFSDDTLMAEYLGYEMLEDMGAVSCDTVFVALSINGEYQGLYLSVESVNDEFLEEQFGNSNGELYKPDSETGADLAYISDDPEDYTGIIPENGSLETDDKFVDLVTTIDQIVANGGETDVYTLSDVMNVDSFLSYLAFSTVTVHLDAYQAGMFHNYYLYYNTDTDLYEWITWDLNMIFNKFPGSGLTDEEATQFLIDEPVKGALDNYPLVQAVFTNEAYIETYHDYIEVLLSGYLEADTFESKVTETYDMIKDYASIDPTAFYSIDEVTTAIYGGDNDSVISLLDFVALRSTNIEQQLSGALPSSNNGLGNTGTGSKMGGGGQGQVEGEEGVGRQRPGGLTEGEAPTGDLPEGRMPPGNLPAGEIPEGEIPEGEIPEREMPAGDKPEGAVREAGTASMMEEEENASDGLSSVKYISIFGAMAVAGTFAAYLGHRKY